MKPITTKDGSNTFYVSELDEYYHSIHGAVQESLHVFINAGFLASSKSSICIFEMGFGTGLNALLTALYNKSKKDVQYYSVEKYPISVETSRELNYELQHFDNLESAQIFEKLHTSEWNKPVEINESFQLYKLNGDIKGVEFEAYPKFDIVYYDAFAPSAQPDLWEVNILKKIYNAMSPKSILVTYCAKGSFKRNLKTVGFFVESLPGPKGKREMTRAWKM